MNLRLVLTTLSLALVAATPAAAQETGGAEAGSVS